MRQGTIPMILGTIVTAGGIAMRVPDVKKNGMDKEEILPMVATGLIGYGLAHIILGGMDIIQDRWNVRVKNPLHFFIFLLTVGVC